MSSLRGSKWETKGNLAPTALVVASVTLSVQFSALAPSSAKFRGRTFPQGPVEYGRQGLE